MKKNQISKRLNENVKKMNKAELVKFKRILNTRLPALIDQAAKDAKGDENNE